MNTPTQFTNTTRRHGLYRKGMGVEATRELRYLVKAKKVPLVKPVSWEQRSAPPSQLKYMGKLISAGFARLNGDHYEPTPEGCEWLAQIEWLEQIVQIWNKSNNTSKT